MVHIKNAYPQEKYEAVFRELWVSMWEQGHDISKPELMAQTLSRHFSADEVKQILQAANSSAVKQELNDNTKRALDSGAFGCPWYAFYLSLLFRVMQLFERRLIVGPVGLR